MADGLKPAGSPFPEGVFTLVFCTAPMTVSLGIIERLRREEPGEDFVLYARREYAEIFAKQTGLAVIPFEGDISLKRTSQWQVMSLPRLRRVIYLFSTWWHFNVTTALYYIRRVVCPNCRIFRASEEKTTEELYYSMDFESDHLAVVAAFTVLAVPLYLAVRLMSPFFLFRFKCFDGAYGDFLQETLSMHAASAVYRKKREVFVSYSRRKINRDFVFRKVSGSLNFSEIARFVHLCTKIFGGYKRHTISDYELRPVVLPRMGEVPPGLILSNAEKSKGAQILAREGIPSHRKIICVHVRDSAFFREKFKDDLRRDRAVNENRFRDWHGTDIIPMAKALNRQGYAVIKMGTNHPPMPSETGNIIFDYANSSISSPFMDCYLANRCEFYLSSDSGPSNMANLMRKPLMLVNLYNLNLMLLKEAMGVYLKHFIDTRSGKKLCLSEICDRNLHWQMPDATIFLGKGVKVENNTPAEIAQSAEEIKGRVTGTWRDTPEDKELRQRFNDILLHYFKNIRYGHNYPALVVNAPISTMFLRNNPEFVN